MGVFRDFLGKMLSSKDTEIDVISEKIANEIYVKELAINCAINIIAKLMSSSENLLKFTLFFCDKLNIIC